MSAIGDFLPQLGSAISSFITAISRLLEGDYEGALSALGEGVKTLVNGVAGLQVDLLTALAEGVSTLVTGLGNLVGVDTSAVTNVIDGFVSALQSLPTDLVGALGDIGPMLNTALVDPIKEQVAKARAYFTGEGFDSLKSRIMAVPGMVIDWLKDLGTQLGTALLMPFVTVIDQIWAKLTGQEEGSLAGYIMQLPAKVADALKGLLGTLEEHLLGPFERVINEILGKLNFVGDVVNKLLGTGGTDEMQLGGAEATGGYVYTYPTDERGVPTGGYVPAGGRQHGGRVLPGRRYIVGERGWELFEPDVPGKILSHLDSERVMRQPMMQPMMAPVPALAGAGGPSGMNFYGDWYLNGVQNAAQLLRELEQTARRGNRTLIKPAGVRRG